MEKHNKVLTLNEVYRVALYFLDRWFQEFPSDDLASVLGGMLLVGNGRPVDLSVWKEWEKAAATVTSAETTFFSYKEAFLIMLQYLSVWAQKGEGGDISKIIYTISDATWEIYQWDKWVAACKQVQAGKDDSYISLRKKDKAIER